MKDKKEWRKKILAVRDQVKGAKVKEAAVHQRLNGIIADCKSSKIYCYLSYGAELDLRPLMEEFPELAWYVPKVEGERMDFYSYKLGDEVQINRWGIEEPVGGEKSTPVTDDIVLVPCVGVDTFGTRLGYGGGYYDKYFSELPDVTLIAPIYSCQYMDELPSEDHDLKVDAVVSEDFFRLFGKESI